MGRKLLAFLSLFFAAVFASAQAVDARICDILSHPSSWDGKLVRITGTVIAGFDEFVVKDASCKLPVNSIWVAYPEGTRAKSGPAVAVYLQLAKNSPGQPAPVTRTAVKLEADKEFKRFDDALSAQPKVSGRCLGCFRSTVTATLTGRLDGVDKPGLDRPGSMFTAVRGFGNLNLYPARLVLQSVSNITAIQIDYSKPATAGDGNVELRLSPEGAQRAGGAYGAEGEHNGVELNFGSASVLSKDDGARGSEDSPDGLLFKATFSSDQIKGGGPGMSEAIAHTGSHIADLRENPNGRSLFELEARAWCATLVTAVSLQEKSLTAPGGYLLWDKNWSDADRQKIIPGAISGLLTNWSGLGR
jgi:hypothetical protein